MESSMHEKNGATIKSTNIQKSPSRSKFLSLVSLPGSWLQNTARPILSLKLVRPTRGSATMILVFLLKIAALEVLRRKTKTKYPQIWWGLQGLPLLQAPGISWLQKWTPFHFLFKGAKVFSKPIFILSLATTITNAFEEHKGKNNAEAFSRILSLSDSSKVISQHGSGKISEELNALQQLHEELIKADIQLPVRFNNDELERFIVATNGNVKDSTEKVKRTIKWRRTYYFLSKPELRKWLPLVFWHGQDIKLRPVLIIRLGQAFKILKAQRRPQFVQAIVSQVEYGTINLLQSDDPRVSVIIDCDGASVHGVPMHLMKSCCLLFQENYPTYLAALIAINVPESLKELANDILQILEPATCQKISLAGEDYSQIIEAYVGGLNHISLCLVGQCRCKACIQARKSDSGKLAFQNSRAPADSDDELERVEGVQPTDQLTSYQNFPAIIRMIIVSLLILWIVVALVFGLGDSDYKTVGA